MPSLTSGIQIALQAVLTHSQAIEIIEHNVSNANTVGYRRQSGQLTATVASQMYMADHGPGAGMRGSGVMIQSIQRFNLQFFDGRYRGITADQKNWDAQQNVMVQLEQTLAETSAGGLIPALDQFWTGWQQVAADPANTALRKNLIADAGALTGALNQRAQQLVQLRSDQDEAINSRVDEINSIGSQVAELNGQISRVLSIGEQPNDLLDKRDLLLDRLAEVSGATSSVQKNGEVVVSIGGHVLVTGQSTMKVQSAPVASNQPLKISWEDGQAFSAPSGEIKGVLEVRDTTIPEQQKALNDVAQALMTNVNNLHRTGYGLDGSTNLDFFTGTDAASIKVNKDVTAMNLAVAGIAGEAGDSAIAESIAALKLDSTLMGSGTQTINGFYNSVVTSLGQTIDQAKSSSDHFNTIAKALGQQRESVAGVSLDEEAANMAKSQKAYEAAARLMTVYDDLLDRIINGMGITR